jgi:hypothetical protein
VATMKSRPHHFPFTVQILLAGVSLIAQASCQGQPLGPHHAPWDSPVAWSQTIHAGGSTIQLDVAPGPLDLSHADVADWVETAARAVSEYYGRFPVSRARVLVVPAEGRRGVLSGSSWGDVDGLPAFTRMRIGEHTTGQDLVNDWTMTHEFVHTALPSLDREHHWLEEGLATYVEPIARAQIGTLTPEFVWEETVKGMPQGEPLPGENGLDNTHTWASTYWGGGLFCMMADIEIRKATHNRMGLQDALRGIVAAGGSIAMNWPIKKVISVADRATGTRVLARLYQQMGERSFAPIDLNALWKQLGIQPLAKSVTFDDRAPLAAIRQAIIAPRKTATVPDKDH